MIINMPKKEDYELPQGQYRAVLREAFARNKGETEKLRLVFEITSLQHPRIIYLAGKEYSQSDGAKLSNDLNSWLGKEFDSLVNDNGELTLETIQSLRGREADIEVVDIHNDREMPFKHIQRILPPGKLVDDERIAA